jgi:hypothetical protein
MADALAGIADELYGIPPTEFIAARDARVRDEAGDKELAARIQGLRRPAPVAWVTNLLVRERRDELDELLELGVALREAQSSLDREAITRLAKERRVRVQALARAGAQLADEAGHRVAPAVLDAVATTLDAGLADPEAAEAIRTGRLLRGLETIGFEPVDLAEAIAAPEAGSRAAEKRAAPAKPKLHAVDDADAELVRARTRADAAIERAEQDAGEAAADLDRLEDELRTARKALAAAEREAESLRLKRDTATEAHEKARATLDAARARRRELG